MSDSYIIVTEVFLPSCGHGRCFKIPIDPNYGDFNYRSRTSINAFFFGTKRRNEKKGKVLYHSQNEESYKIHCDCLRNSSVPHDIKVPRNLNSIWEFYKIIGYDYKKRKWL